MMTPRCPGIAGQYLGLRGLVVTALLLATGCAADRLPQEPARIGQHPVIHDYVAPADSLFDPWGQHIAEAASLFDVPEMWIREVMERESSGRRRAVSPAGAMGLMQVMPGTWRELRQRYRLGRDPFDPRDNILAGTAYIREMYERFGAPGFLAAYNAGPGAFSRYLARASPLPRETRRFVAAIAPRIDGIAPQSRAAPAVYAAVPASLLGRPSGPTRPAPTALAWRPRSAPPPAALPAVTAAAPGAVPPPPREPLLVAASAAPAPLAAPAPVAEPPSRGLQLISAARAAPAVSMPPPASAADEVAPSPPLAGGWSIQVGAFRSLEPARGAIDQARAAAPELLAHALAATPDVDTPNGRFVRARLVGLSPEAARAACRMVERRGQGCFAVAPARG
jgi:D-alanyl-D-alanine carboxypeptidase